MNLKENEFLQSLLILKMLYGHVYTKEIILNQCNMLLICLVHIVNEPL